MFSSSRSFTWTTDTRVLGELDAKHRCFGGIVPGGRMGARRRQGARRWKCTPNAPLTTVSFHIELPLRARENFATASLLVALVKVNINRFVVIATVGFHLLSACTPNRGIITDRGFEHTLYGYEVRASAAGLMGKDWRLDNFFVDYRKKFEQKKLGHYTTTYVLDRDGDGVPDYVNQEPTFDLHFTHAVTSGTIWLRTLPLPKKLERKALRVMMQHYVDGLAGTEYDLVSFGDIPVVERRYASEVVEQGAGKVAGQEAFFATVNVANVDQLHLNQTRREEKLRVAFVRMPFKYIAQKREEGDGSFPVVMFAGFSSMPDDFDQGVTDFNEMLTRVVINPSLEKVALGPVGRGVY